MCAQLHSYRVSLPPPKKNKFQHVHKIIHLSKKQLFNWKQLQQFFFFLTRERFLWQPIFTFLLRLKTWTGSNGMPNWSRFFPMTRFWGHLIMMQINCKYETRWSAFIQHIRNRDTFDMNNRFWFFGGFLSRRVDEPSNSLSESYFYNLKNPLRRWFCPWILFLKKAVTEPKMQEMPLLLLPPLTLS